MRFLLGLLMLVTSGSASATIDAMQLKGKAQGRQFRQLTEQLRCPKCQNNSIVDSNSMVITDLRQKVYELMQEGKSQKEIVDYMVARYGDFITYDPLLTSLTVLLWMIPVVVIGPGGWITFACTHRRVWVKLEKSPDDVIPDGKHDGFRLFVPGIVMALIVGATSYYKTDNYRQVQIWQQAIAQAPTLLGRALDSKADPLNEEDITHLALGLRMRSQADPTSVEGWTMFGCIGMVLGSASTITEAYTSAYRLDLESSDAALDYAEAPTRSSNPDDNRRRGEPLCQLVHGEHANVRVLSIYAFDTFEQQRFGEAVAAWGMVPKLLPADDIRRAMIERDIKQAMEQLTPQKK